MSQPAMLEYRSVFTLEERLLLSRLRTNGITIGGMVREPWAYTCGLTDIQVVLVGLTLVHSKCMLWTSVGRLQVSWNCC
jgi:hypothetical protein